MSYNYLIQLKKLRPHVGLLIKVLRADARACGHNKYHIIIVSTAYQQVLWYTVAERIPNATRYWYPVDSERSGAVGKSPSVTDCQLSFSALNILSGTTRWRRSTWCKQEVK